MPKLRKITWLIVIVNAWFVFKLIANPMPDAVGMWGSIAVVDFALGGYWFVSRKWNNDPDTIAKKSNRARRAESDCCKYPGCLETIDPVLGACSDEHANLLMVEYAKRSSAEARSSRGVDSRHAAIICPHCGERGQVTLSKKRTNQGLSGGKSALAVVTGGASLLLGTGLARFENRQQAACANCGVKWMI